MIFKEDSEVFNLVKPIIDKWKAVDAKFNNQHRKPTIDDYPDFYPNFKTACKYAQRIKIHAECGEFPEQLFHNRYPNQSDKEFKYIKENYKQNTLPVFVDYLSTITRPFSDGNWNIEYGEEQDEFVKAQQSFQQYVEDEIEVVRSVKDFVKSVLPSIKSVDANGVIAIRPESISTFLNEDGEQITDDTVLVRPQPYYFPVNQVLTDPLFDDEYFILESVDKSWVEYGSRKQKIGHVFEVYDEENIWRVEQIGSFIDYQFNVSLYYFHGSGKVQAMRLKGIPQYINGSFLWQSPFMYACDLLDRALLHDNYLNCSLANVMFPYRVMVGSKCTYRHKGEGGTSWPCDGGKVFDSKFQGQIDCPGCGGSGLKDRVSPGGVMLLNPSDMNTDGDIKFSGKAMEYVSPETASSELMMKVIDSNITKAYGVIKAKQTTQAKGTGITPASGTATEAVLDVKAMYSAVKLFSDQAFSIYDFILSCIGTQRYGDKFNKPTLIYPTSFDFNTEKDYLEQITAAQNANLPPPVIEHIIYKYLQTIYFNQKQTAAIFNLLTSTDRLLVLSQSDVMIKFNRGLVQPWEIYLHDSATQLIDELLSTHAEAEFCGVDDCTRGFFGMEFVDQQKLLIALAKKKADEAKAAGATTSLVDKARMQALPPAA